MSEIVRQNPVDETCVLTARLDEVCDRFEAACQSGAVPRLEDFLAELPETTAALGFRELLQIELTYRKKAGDRIVASEYRSRFPQQTAVIDEVVGIAGEYLQRLGDYELLDIIGRGGMGVVYKARHARLNRIVAVKVLPDRLLTSHKQLLARFQQEMQSIGRLKHRNIVEATDAREESGVHVLVMEYVEGLSLDKLVARAPLAPADACELARQAAEGLQHAHEQRLVHRDIKPSNLILSQAGCVKIVDFGLARLNEERLSLGLTNSQQTLGTLDYMAPEQFDDASRVDIRADIYSLGCTLFTLLAGSPPFPAPQYSSLASKMQAHCLVAPPKISALRPDVPLGVSNIVEQMLAKQPGNRFGSPIQVAKALAPFAAGSNPCELVQDRQHAANRSNNPVVGQTSNYLSNPSTETNGGEFKPAESVAPIAVAAPQFWKSAAFRIAVAAALLIGVVLWAAWPRPDPDGGNKLNDPNRDQAGSSLSNKPQLSLAAVVGTAPGLTGVWWFDETPWLIPQARQRWLPFMKVGLTAPESARKDLSDRLTKLTALANGSDVFEFQQQLKLLATEHLPGGTWDETRERVELCNLLDLSGNPGADSKQLGIVRDLLFKKCRTGGDKADQPELDKLSAADCHLFAVVLHRMARSSNVGDVLTPSDSKSARAEAAPRRSAGLSQSSDRPGDPSVTARLSLWKDAKSAYELALKKYERDGDQTMTAACFADLAEMHSDQGYDAAAVDNFRLAQISLPEGKSPLFETFVLCGQANSDCQLSKHNAAHECLKLAEKTAAELPPDHPLRAYVWECMAWYYMDRDYMDTAARSNAVTYFDKAKGIREVNAKRDPRASRDIFHDRHGAALALQYRGVFEHDPAALNESKQRFTEILRELTEQLADPRKIYERDPEQITPQMRNDLVQRKINALEREADGYLFGSPREFKTAAEHYLEACAFIKSEGLDRNLKSNTVVSLLFKRAMALAFAGDLVAAGQCKAEADELFASLKDENKPLAFVRTVATSAIDLMNHHQTTEQIRHNFVAVFREKLTTQDDQRHIHLLRDNRLQFDVLAEKTDPDLFEKVSEEALKPK